MTHPPFWSSPYHGWAGHAIGLAATIFRDLDVGYFADAAAMLSHAWRAAAQSGDRIAVLSLQPTRRPIRGPARQPEPGSEGHPGQDMASMPKIPARQIGPIGADPASSTERKARHRR